MSARELLALTADENPARRVLGKRHRKQAEKETTQIPTVAAIKEGGRNKKKDEMMKVVERVQKKDPAKLSTGENKILAEYLLGSSNCSLKNALKKLSKVSGGAKRNGTNSGSEESSVQQENKRGEILVKIHPGRNVITLPSLPMRLDVVNHPTAFRNMKRIGEKQEYRRQTLAITSHDEIEVLVEAERKIREKILSDPQLAGNVKRRAAPRIKQAVMKMMAHRLYEHLNGWDHGKKKTKEMGLEKAHIDFALQTAYSPPEERVLITANLSPNAFDNIRVYSDLAEDLKNLHKTNIPKNMFYTYTDRNSVSEVAYEELTAFTKAAESKENIIRCDCCSSEPIVKCWQNPDCACYKANVVLMENQRPEYQDNFHGKTTFSTFDPVILKTTEFYDTVGFACSHACACAGKCTNNVTMIAEKKLNQFEIFRRSSLLGFGIRAMNFIPAGMPMMEFVGELIKLSDIKKDETRSYSFNIVCPTQDKLVDKFVEMKKNWSDSFKSEMRKVLGTTWCLNPLDVGNLARTCCHSCEPNATVVRVFQKGFSPAHIRLMLVAMEDIFPGTEITIDYGVNYWEDMVCQCEKIGCSTSGAYDEIKNSSQRALRSYYGLRHHKQYHDFSKNILSQLD